MRRSMVSSVWDMVVSSMAALVVGRMVRSVAFASTRRWAHGIAVLVLIVEQIAKVMN